MSRFWMLFMLTILVDCSNARNPSRIKGGTDAQLAEFPWQASLRIYDTHICGGTIISLRHILTAAHCVVGVVEAPYFEMTVVTGTNTLSPGTGKAYRVKEIAYHEKYVPRSEHVNVQYDIAVIGLKKEIEQNKFQSAIALPTRDITSGNKAIVTGFGRTKCDHAKLSTVLQKIEVTILNNQDCLTSGVRVLRDGLCAVGSDIGVHKGDSGGPLVYQQQVVGIVSSSSKCGLGIPDTYTRVYRFLDFIAIAIAKT